MTVPIVGHSFPRSLRLVLNTFADVVVKPGNKHFRVKEYWPICKTVQHKDVDRSRHVPHFSETFDAN